MPFARDEDRFESLALALFDFQYGACEPYRRFCQGRGATPAQRHDGQTRYPRSRRRPSRRSRLACFAGRNPARLPHQRHLQHRTRPARARHARALRGVADADVRALPAARHPGRTRSHARAGAFAAGGSRFLALPHVRRGHAGSRRFAERLPGAARRAGSRREPRGSRGGQRRGAPCSAARRSPSCTCSKPWRSERSCASPSDRRRA